MVNARHDGRAVDALRPLQVEPGWVQYPAGSVLLSMGSTRVLCTASVDDTVPPFLVGKGEGWVTGEYAMLPAATNTRSVREVTRGRPSGRTLEIQRLIGRSLRAVVDRRVLGPRTVTVDCDVLQADGGTRTASITGGYLAMVLALDKLGIARCLTGMVAAVSVGMVDGRPLLDLDYAEDSTAEVDMNVVRTDDGRFIELQGTAESTPFRRQELDRMLALADVGLDLLLERQRQILGAALDRLRA